MTTRFIALAERSSAQFFKLEDDRFDTLAKVAMLSNPDGRLHEGDILAGDLGSAQHGNSLHTMAPERSATETVARRFASDVSEMIRRARLDGSYDHAVVVAGPTFLGLIRDKLDPADEKFVRRTIGKNIVPGNEHETKQQLVTLLEDVDEG